LGHQERHQAFIVNYADDLVLCCRGQAQEALAAMRAMMIQLKLTVNESKTRVCEVSKERFDFLGYTFGRLWSPRTGRPYLGVCPSKKRIQRLCERISELTDRRYTPRASREMVADLNRLAVGWANYFCLGSVSKAYRIVDEHLRYRLRMWLNHKHKVRLGVHHIDAEESRVLGLICLTGRKGSLPWAKA
jgi:hypothetical protein